MDVQTHQRGNHLSLTSAGLQGGQKVKNRILPPERDPANIPNQVNR